MIATPTQNAPKQIGNKAHGLLWLSENNLPVPPFQIVSLHDMVRDYDTLIEKAHTHFHAKEFEKVAALLEAISWNEAEVQRDFMTLKEIFTARVSFRTSGTLEDTAEHSFAGVYSTLLDVPFGNEMNIKTFQANLLTCMHSLFSPRTHAYLTAKNLCTNARLNCTVIVQEMYTAEFSGVSFSTSNGTTITYAPGPCIDVVNGKTGTDIANVTHKTPPPSDIAQKDCQKSWAALTKTLQEIHTRRGAAQDIEWAIRRDSIAILQVRDVTHSLPRALPETTIDEEIFDCTNIIESYPGVTLPLTYSFITTAYENVYASFMRLVGVKKTVIKKNRHILSQLLGYIDGRVYYRIHNWYRMIALLPGYRYNKTFFEAMLVPKKNLDESENKTIVQKKPMSLAGKAAQAHLMLTFGYKLLAAKRPAQKFIKTFNKKLRHHKKTDLAALETQQLIEHYQTLLTAFLNDWKVPILNDFRVMIFHGILQKILTRLDKNDTQTAMNTLLSGFTSTKNDSRLLDDLHAIVATIKNNSELTTLFESDAKKILRDITHYPELEKVFTTYLRAHGSRRPDELKLENLSLEENPATLVQIMKQMINKTHTGTFRHKTKDSTTVIKKLLKDNPRIQQVMYLPLLLFISQKAKHAIRLREEFRFKRGQAFGIARECFVEMGNRLAKNSVIEHRDDVFYLTVGETLQMLQHESFDKDYTDRVRKRKNLARKYDATSTLPRRLARTGIGKNACDAPDGTDTNTSLSGVAAATGTTVGEALVVTTFDPKENYDGKILVTLHTDPGWTIIFPLLKGVVLEKGNILSHGAIISREMGLPCIVKVDNATKTIHTGDIIELNGQTGKITRREKMT